jgi:hypothetical protein
VLGLDRDGDEGVWSEMVLGELGAAAEVFLNGGTPPFGRHFRRAALTELALAGAFEPGGDAIDGLAARFVRTWQRLAWLGLCYRARPTEAVSPKPTVADAGSLWRRVFNQPAAAAWPGVEDALPGRADALVGVGWPLCECSPVLRTRSRPVAAANDKRRGWPFLVAS